VSEPHVPGPLWVPNACHRMSKLVDGLVDQQPDLGPRELLVELGARAAGIPRSGLRAPAMLVLGGRTRLPGGGFRPEFRDRSSTQARHFAGVARAATLLGPERTEWLCIHVRRDPPDSPDGRLTTAAVSFAKALLDGELATADAGEWIRGHVCGRS
jgi:hypothetical protein